MNPEQDDRQQFLLGAMLVGTAGLMYALSGICIKLATPELPSGTVVFWRNAFSMAYLLPWAILRWPASLQTKSPGLVALRAVASTLTIYCYYYAVSRIPLADAVLLSFSAPIFIPLLGFVIFRFPFDRVAILAILLGFAGVALVVKPGTTVFHPAAMWGVAGALLQALSTVAVWRMPSGQHPATVALWFAVLGATLSAPYMVWAGAWPSGTTWIALVCLGATSTAANLLLIKGLLIAPADRMSIINYTAVLFAALFGWLFWDESLDMALAAGAVLIAIAGVIATTAGRKARTKVVQ